MRDNSTIEFLPPQETNTLLVQLFGQVRNKMILNDTLQKHKDCLELCEIEHTVCELDQKDDKKCDTEVKICHCNCDFDFGQ